MIYRTHNFQKTEAGVKSIAWLLVFVFFPVLIISIIAFSGNGSPQTPYLLGFFCTFPVLLILGLRSAYRRAYRNLSYSIQPEGLLVKFYNKTLIPWDQIISFERVNPMLILNNKIRGLDFGELNHGLFNTRLGCAWVWLAGEREGLFIRTSKRNYVIAPENLGEFEKEIQSRIHQS
jgi:hypothetical protein